MRHTAPDPIRGLSRPAGGPGSGPGPPAPGLRTMTPAVTDLPAVEQALWQAATTYDRAFMAGTMADDFIEFRRSGAFYPREAMLAAPNATQDVQAVLHDIAVRALSTDFAIVTYVSEVRYPSGTEWSNRSSMWDRSSGARPVRFHQGTPRKART